MSKIVNVKFVLKLVSYVIIFEGLFMFIDIFISILYGGRDLVPILTSSIITLGAGGILYFSTFKIELGQINKRESFMIVGLSWILISLFGTLPYLLSHSLINFTDALFESVSGFTTTGSSVIADVESLPRGVLFWRAETHWIGGMGIIVLALAILPFVKRGANQLAEAEGSINGVDKLKPKMIDTAKRLWSIYIMLTFAEFVMLMLGGMNWYDAICHSFATIATGGFSTKNNSVAGYSPYIQYIIVLFMFLSGMNFSLHYIGIKGKIKKLLRNEEFKLYSLIIIASTLFITMSIVANNNYGVFEAFRHAIFQVVSIITATGFASADYSGWSHFAITIIFLIMFIGACVGSTGGGIKVSRYLLFFKVIKNTLINSIHPNGVNIIKYNNKPVSDSLISGILSFIILYFITFALGTIFMSCLGLDLDTSSSSIITTLGGIGPGLGMVGPANTFAGVPIIGKVYLSFNMLLGRLELYSLLMMFVPAFWKI